jgi:hypothetical protein
MTAAIVDGDCLHLNIQDSIRIGRPRTINDFHLTRRWSRRPSNDLTSRTCHIGKVDASKPGNNIYPLGSLGSLPSFPLVSVEAVEKGDSLRQPARIPRE